MPPEGLKDYHVFSLWYNTQMICNAFNCLNEISEKRLTRKARFCTDACRNKTNVTIKRRRNKEKLVELFGGKCTRCGYNKCIGALQFHHKDDDKSFGIAEKGRTPSFDSLVEEAKKCILICANCHAELHAL